MEPIRRLLYKGKVLLEEEKIKSNLEFVDLKKNVFSDHQDSMIKDEEKSKKKIKSFSFTRNKR